MHKKLQSVINLAKHQLNLHARNLSNLQINQMKCVMKTHEMLAK